MGGGITTSNGADPCDEFASRINNLGSPELSQHARALLHGDVVEPTTGGLEIYVADIDSPRAHKLTLEFPGAPVVVDVIVEARDASTIDDPDPRSALPSPDVWMTPQSHGFSWELFNCVIAGLRLRESSP